jgi:hypothetical protein
MGNGLNSMKNDPLYEIPEIFKKFEFLNPLKHTLHLFPTLGVQMASGNNAQFLLDAFNDIVLNN